MTIAAWAALLLVSGGDDRPDRSHVLFGQLTVQQRVIVRVPTRPPPVAPRAAPDRWRERKGPSCIPANALGGASVSNHNSVDLLLKGGKRVRAKLQSDCPALDYYSGFYLRPGKDGMVCEDRDSIHARSGGKCQIDRFRSLTPQRPR